MQSTTTADFPTLAKIARITRICQLVSSVVMVYDYLISVDQEVEQIWRRPKTTTTILYLILRYFGTLCGVFNAAVFFSDVSKEFCNTFMIVQGWPACFLVWLVQIILQLRLYALYNRSRKVLIFMGSGFLVEIMAMTAILVVANLTSGTSSEPIPGVKICTNEDTSNSFYVFWLPILCFEFLLCSLAVRAGIQRSRDDISFIPLSNRVFLLDVLVKGNVGYFLVIFFVGVVNAVMWGALSPEWVEVPEGFPHAVAVIAGCRLILHIRNAASPPSEDTFQGSLAFEYPLQQRSAISASTV
ncbi:hypothetical protein PISMIDRAFT_680676 [Pisolithus microcarpus 441]|uniref:Unplaced genomic scaffold scaffold_59, whole genome shotgun sequence n=1 Tax=Pisolithus microcarpus 441 TaxID=765257 RepID=A0A0C9YZD3_9AGAM|nr:hypothetical protein PISMIDRAFT_680676 [Pisolithus microcarpus 441]